MKLSYTVIDPTKNITLLVTTPVPRDAQPRLAARLLRLEKEAEQVGFVEESADHPARLQMMGGEFCGNATMGFGAWLCQHVPVGQTRELSLEVSGAPHPVSCSITPVSSCWMGTVDMPLPEKLAEVTLPFGEKELTLPVVFLPGICHIIAPADLLTRTQAEQLIRTWSSRFSAEAVGILLLDEASLRFDPLVYVKPTDTMVWERGCGSGSASIGAWLTAKRQAGQCLSVRQPGGTISVVTRWDGGALCSLTISGTVLLLKEKSINITL